MSKISLTPNASGTGNFTIASPNSNTDRTLTLPDSTGTVVVTSGAQTIEFADGSASAPSITNSGDTNTGMFFPAADTIAFAEGGTEAMRIDSSGNLLVNTTTASGSSSTFKSTAGASAQALSLWNNATTGTRYFLSFATEASSTDRGYITYNGTTVAIAQASDERLKENISDAPSALEKINDIKIRSFDWKEDKRHIDYGVIAQELIKVIPSAVFEGANNEDGSINKPWSVGLEPLIPILTKAIQEQQTIIETLKADIAELKAKVNV